MLDKAANAGRAPLRDHPFDQYDTAPEAVVALLKVEKIPHLVGEPCCGTGNIVRVLRAAGHKVVASDLHRRGCPQARVLNFITHTDKFPTLPIIVTNPPYSLAEQFIERALTRAPRVIMLLRLAFLESAKRAPLLDTGLLARVHVFANRLPMMHRASWRGKRASSAIAFGWFVFDRRHKGPATIDRIFWERQ